MYWMHRCFWNNWIEKNLKGAARLPRSVRLNSNSEAVDIYIMLSFPLEELSVGLSSIALTGLEYRVVENIYKYDFPGCILRARET